MPFYYIPNINFLFFSSEIVLVSSGVKYFTSDDMAFSYFTGDGFGTTFLKTKKRRGKKTYHSARLSPEYLVLWELHASVEFAVCYIHVQMDNAG